MNERRSFRSFPGLLFHFYWTALYPPAIGSWDAAEAYKYFVCPPSSPDSRDTMGIQSLFVLAFFSFIARSMAVVVTIPFVAPTGATQVAQTLIGFSLEQDRWTDWVGLNSRNQFFFNVLDNLKISSGKPPFIRIGANSEDRTNFNPNVQVCSQLPE